MNKQIEDMSEFLWDVQSREDEIEIFNTEALAKRLVDANYRKSTDVAREIFAEIEQIIALQVHKCEVFRDKEFDKSDKKYYEGGEWSLRQISYWIAELKKKYESEGEK